MIPALSIHTGLLAFWLVLAAVHLAATIWEREPLRSRTKLLLMPLLAWWVMLRGGRFAVALAVALILAGLGDACLL